MRIIVPMMILIMMTSTLAGCTGGDPDGGGNDEIDMDVLNSLIDDNLQDFINNTTITVENHYHNNTTIVNDNNVNSTNNLINAQSELYYQDGEFGYYGDDYLYDLGVWTEYKPNSWTYVGTPSNWIDIMTINQSQGEMITLIYVSFTGLVNNSIGDFSNQSYYDVFSFGTQEIGNWKMNCSNGISTSLSDAPNMDDGQATPSIDHSGTYSGYGGGWAPDIFPFPGIDCIFTLSFRSQTEWSMVNWHIVYEVIEVTELQ